MNNKFASICIGRRSIAAAVFAGLKLDFWEVRSFQANTERAKISITAFVNSLTETMNIEAAGLPKIPEDLQTRMSHLTGQTKDLFQKRGIPVTLVDEQKLFEAYAEPPLKSRAALREIALSLFPELRSERSDKGLLDAAILGLYIQTERLLKAAESEPE